VEKAKGKPSQQQQDIALPEALEKINHDRQRKTFQDPGEREHVTMMEKAAHWFKDLWYDGYHNDQQIYRTFDLYFMRNNKESLRDIVAQELGMFALLRSGDQRRIGLSKLSAKAFQNEGPTPCFAVVITTREGKTNKHEKVQYAAMMGNKDINICPVFFLSIYLFCR
jgi:hypothetical protein